MSRRTWPISYCKLSLHHTTTHILHSVRCSISPDKVISLFVMVKLFLVCFVVCMGATSEGAQLEKCDNGIEEEVYKGRSAPLSAVSINFAFEY